MKEENMTAQKLITVGENENTVFRSCKDGIHTNVFETICAFLNTRGGTLLLGGLFQWDILPHTTA